MKQLFTFITIILISIFGQLSAQISIIGQALPSGDWDNDHDLTESIPGVWTGTYELSVGVLKFRLDHNWDFNWGGTSWPSGPAIQGGSNINVSLPGIYKITLNLNNTENYMFLRNPTAVEII